MAYHGVCAFGKPEMLPDVESRKKTFVGSIHPMNETLRVVILTTDARGACGCPVEDYPNFGTAIRSLLKGFEMLGEQGQNPEIGGQWSKVKEPTTNHESGTVARSGAEEGERLMIGDCSLLKGRHGASGDSQNGNQESEVINQQSAINNPLHPPSFEIHVISCTQQVMASPEKLAPNIWFHSLHVPKWGWLRSGYLGCVLAVRRKLKEIQPDLVHAHGTERDCAISAVLSPYPRLLTIHGNLRLIRKQVGFKPFSALWFQSFLEGIAVPRFDGVVCITNYTREAVEHEVPKTWVVPNAVDPLFLALGQQRLIDSSSRPWTLLPRPLLRILYGDFRDPSPIILVVANVDERKNQNAFIRALDPLAARIPLEIRFFGKCGEDDYAREFRALLSSRPWCRYGGMIGRDVLRREFGTAAMLALPTHEDNCPMVVLEAMAAGVPVIASKVGGVPDLIDGVRTGLFCDPLTPSSFRDGVQRILGDVNFAAGLALSAHEEAKARFHPAVIAQRHTQIYRQTLDAAGNS